MWELPYLPTCATGTVMRVKDFELQVSTEEGVDADIVACLSSWQFKTDHIHVVASEALEDLDHHIALTNTLQQLSALQAPDACVELRGWHWTAAMGEAVAAAAPDLAHLNLCVHVDTLTDELLGAVLLMGPHMRRLSVGQLDLRSDQHADKPWPWDELRVGTCDMASMVRLPSPLGEGSPRKVLCGRLDIGSGATNSVMFHRVTQWLSHVIWAPLINEDTDREDLTISLHCPQYGASLPTSLCQQLDLLRGVRLQDPDELCIDVRLAGWSFTHATMEALAGLPDDWEATLTFHGGDWPLPHKEYVALATHIPTCYWKWDLGFTSPCVRRLQSIMMGVTEWRASEEGAGRLTLIVKSRKAVRVMERMGLENDVCVSVDEE